MDMDLFELGRFLHSVAGSVALVAFWTAATAPKGGTAHRKAGSVYLFSLVAVMIISTLMVAGKAIAGDSGTAIFLAFLISMVGTASFLTWFSFRYRREPDRLLGFSYRALATWLIAAGIALFTLGVTRTAPLMMFLSLLGVGFGANMWRLALARERRGRWWVAHHTNGVMLNFIATHDSFIALGIGSVLPELRERVPRMLVAAGITAVALSIRIYLGKRSRAVASSPPSRTLPQGPLPNGGGRLPVR
jgi:hypothetical protein